MKLIAASVLCCAGTITFIACAANLKHNKNQIPTASPQFGSSTTIAGNENSTCSSTFNGKELNITIYKPQNRFNSKNEMQNTTFTQDDSPIELPENLKNCFSVLRSKTERHYQNYLATPIYLSLFNQTLYSYYNQTEARNTTQNSITTIIPAGVYLESCSITTTQNGTSMSFTSDNLPQGLKNVMKTYSECKGGFKPDTNSKRIKRSLKTQQKRLIKV